MAKPDKSVKVCWWTKAGNIMDYVLPLTPKEIKKEKKD